MKWLAEINDANLSQYLVLKVHYKLKLNIFAYRTNLQCKSQKVNKYCDRVFSCISTFTVKALSIVTSHHIISDTREKNATPFLHTNFHQECSDMWILYIDLLKMMLKLRDMISICPKSNLISQWLVLNLWLCSFWCDMCMLHNVLQEKNCGLSMSYTYVSIRYEHQILNFSNCFS